MLNKLIHTVATNSLTLQCILPIKKNQQGFFLTDCLFFKCLYLMGYLLKNIFSVYVFYTRCKQCLGKIIFKSCIISMVKIVFTQNCKFAHTLSKALNIITSCMNISRQKKLSVSKKYLKYFFHVRYKAPELYCKLHFRIKIGIVNGLTFF